MRCGLLGKTLTHSYSPQIHNAFAPYRYDLFEIDPGSLAQFMAKKDFDGINVTMPYKKSVIPFCDSLSECANTLGSVNTIVRRYDGTLYGHNTDYFGFRYMLQKSGLRVQNKKVLVLGSGGASLTVSAVLKEAKASVVVISRSGDDNYSNLSKHCDASVIVNTTPLGMYPNTGVCPVELDLFPHLEGVLDVIYNPSRTQLLLDAQRRGLTTLNGLWMLIAQAKESVECFTGDPIDEHQIETVYKKIKALSENIVLIGMPGCGKTTIGRLLADRLGKKFVDSDQEIVTSSGLTIPEIFKNFGEKHFRDLERNVLCDLGKCSGLIIATGGGCVTNSQNYSYLHQNGTIFWLQRALEKLPRAGRPLSQSNKPENLYAQRKELYEAFADYAVNNNGSIEETVNTIIKLGEYSEDSCN